MQADIDPASSFPSTRSPTASASSRIKSSTTTLPRASVAKRRSAPSIPILTGALDFLQPDLMRQMPIAMKIGLITVSSYPGKSLSTQGSHVLGEKVGDVRGRHVLLIDDILDSGGTLSCTVVPLLEKLEPASVKTCVLLRKDRPAARAQACDYVGFRHP